MKLNVPARRPTPWDSHYPHSGYRIGHTKRGFAVVTINYWADDAKRDPAWIKAREVEMPNKADFRREYMNDWTSPAGDAYYPEFWQYGGPDTYVCRANGIITNEPIVRCWDFGFFRPACIWMQKDPRRNRIWVLRELMPGWQQMARPDDGIDVRSFRDTVLYLSGQLPMQKLGARSLTLLQAIAAEPRLPSPPWFAEGAIASQFLDFSGPEALKPSDEPAADTQARTRAAILAEAGIYLQVQTEPWEAREDMVRELLKIRQPCEFGHGHGHGHEQCIGHPGVLFDPACPILIEGVAGGVTFRRSTTDNPCPASPAKNGYHDHVHDAFSYGVLGLTKHSQGPPLPSAPEAYVGRRRMTREEAVAKQESIGMWDRFAKMVGQHYRKPLG